MQATLTASIFGERRIDMMLEEQCCASICAHNLMVEKNRKILWKLVKIVCWLGKQELAFRGNDESVGSKNMGNYRELLIYTASLDPELQAHIDSSNVFKGVSSSSHIQNDLIKSVAHCLQQIIKDEVKKSPFVAILADETTDISCISQFSLVYRYICNGNVMERFICFNDVSENKSASVISTLVLDHIKNFADCGNKLVAQTYDGAAAMSSELNGVQGKVKSVYPQALFVHCYAHVLNLVLSQSVQEISAC